MHPFPFLGAGAASYFEWAEVMVRPAARGGSKASDSLDAPEATGRREMARPHAFRVECSKNQDAGAAVQHGDRPVAPLGALSGTNHRGLSPADLEAGGTTLSSWHTESLKSFRMVWSDLRVEGDELTRHMLKGILGYAKAAKQRLSAEQHEVLDPSPGALRGTPCRRRSSSEGSP